MLRHPPRRSVGSSSSRLNGPSNHDRERLARILPVRSKASIRVFHRRCRARFTLAGVKQDVTDIILNIKVSSWPRQWRVMRLSASGPGEVTADLIEADPSVKVHNPGHVIATLTDAVDFELEMVITRGRGYEPATERHQRSCEEQVIGEIPIDALFSPVRRVRYRVEDTRVGQKTNFDRLVLDVWTDGTISPELLPVEAAQFASTSIPSSSTRAGSTRI